MKALRHEAPSVEASGNRLGVDKTQSAAVVVKTFHTAHGGKLSVARVIAGSFADGTTVYGADKEERVAGVFTLLGQESVKRGPAVAGDTVAFGRLEGVETGDMLIAEKAPQGNGSHRRAPPPVFLAIAVKEKKDEVKLTAAIPKILEEDPSSRFTHEPRWADGALRARGDASACGA